MTEEKLESLMERYWSVVVLAGAIIGTTLGVTAINNTGVFASQKTTIEEPREKRQENPLEDLSVQKEPIIVYNLLTNLLDYLGREDLTLTVDKYMVRIRRKEQIQAGSISSGEVIGGFDYDDKKRINIRVNEGLVDKVKQFLDEQERVYSTHDSTIVLLDTGNHTEFLVYLNANRELLSVQAQPTQGNIQVIQGEYAVTSSTDPNPVLSTFALNPCRGLLLYDPKTKVGGIAHVDVSYTEPDVFGGMLEELKKLGGEKFVFGYSKEIFNPLVKEAIGQKYGHLILRELELPDEFSFDTRDGVVKPYQRAEDQTIERRLERVNHRINENILEFFCTYRTKTKPK